MDITIAVIPQRSEARLFLQAEIRKYMTDQIWWKFPQFFQVVFDNAHTDNKVTFVDQIWRKLHQIIPARF